MLQTDGDWSDLEELISDKLGKEAVEDPSPEPATVIDYPADFGKDHFVDMGWVQ